MQKAVHAQGMFVEKSAALLKRRKKKKKNILFQATLQSPLTAPPTGYNQILPDLPSHEHVFYKICIFLNFGKTSVIFFSYNNSKFGDFVKSSNFFRIFGRLISRRENEAIQRLLWHRRFLLSTPWPRWDARAKQGGAPGTCSERPSAVAKRS